LVDMGVRGFRSPTSADEQGNQKNDRDRHAEQDQE
jgi:hypothetical protein